MTKPVTGQYECVHRSGIGLDYFTSRVDRLTLLSSGRFTLLVQDRSRLSHAASSFAAGQQVSNAAPEVRREGSFVVQGSIVMLRFDDGTQQQGQLGIDAESKSTLQLGQDVFTKVSDSTLFPSADRLKKDMDDIAKGLKIASAIGGVAFKAVKTIHDTISSTQPSQNASTNQTAAPPQNATTTPPPVQQYPTQQATPPPVQRYAPQQPASSIPPYQAPTPSAVPQQPLLQDNAPAVYCDQCGTKARPGKRFCSKCGANLL
jgi:hypothetical protein